MKRGRNAASLAEREPFDFDSRVTFEEEGHVYRVDGVLVPMSVSGIVKNGFQDEFDGPAVVKKNLAGWRLKASSKYHGLVVDKSDEEAEAAVLALWNAGRDAGTALHRYAELWLNGQPAPEDVPREETELLLKGWTTLLSAGHSIVRTELAVFWPPRGPVKAAGQIDFLTRTSGGFAIVDLKRSGSDLTSGAHAFRNGVGVLADVGATSHMKYSLQLSLYAVMLQELTRERVSEMLLLQVDPEAGTARVIPTADLRAQARVLLLGL